MGLITNVDPATRLARAILADIRLYNEEMIRSGRIDPAIVDEARELYRSRVDPSLHVEFDRQFAEFCATNGLGPVSGTFATRVDTVPPRAAAPQVDAPRFGDSPPERDGPSNSAIVGLIVVLVLVAVAFVVVLDGR